MPNWSRDGKYIYFDGSSGTETAFYRVQVSDGRLERLFATKDRLRTDGFLWTGLTPDDSPLLLRDVGTQEVYALDVELP